MKRVFIAFELEKNVRTQLHKIQSKINVGKASIKWVDASNIHLTLRFLGNCSTDLIDKISGVIEISFKDCNPIPITISNLGSFPSIEDPRIIWAGITDTNNQIICIVNQLNNELFKLGIEQEQRDFSSHITLGRVKSINKADHLSQSIKQYQFDASLQQVLHTITLFESTLTPSGPIYTPIIKYTLK